MRGIVVGFDGRPDSRQFARDAACVFAALGIRVFITSNVAATPIVAFGTVHRKAAAGVVITASHNPPEYNGYKVYWDNGAQIIPPHDAGIAAAIELAAEEEIPWLEFDEAQAAGLVEVLGEAFDRAYLDAILCDQLFMPGGANASISIAYTAMHGVGAVPAETLLGEAGFDKVYSVPAQREPDGRFPTVNFPNPEEPGAMDMVIALAREKDANLACANDPDADRLAVAVRTGEGDYQMLTGDMIGVLLGSYLLEKSHPYTPIVCTTIVSSGMLRTIAAAAGADYYETLTGFKWLVNTALGHEDRHHRLLFAYEEALGYAAGRQVLDKDGLSALLAFAQMTEQLAREGKTVLDQLERLYRRHGLFVTAQRSLVLQAGARPIGDLLRGEPPEEIAGSPVAVVEDLGSGLRRYAGGDTEPLNFPPSDVLIYRLDNGARIIVRPSGTEPKVKCYYELQETVAREEDFADVRERAESALLSLVEAHQASLARLLSAA
ncbi:MAG: phospho-sugar mutase [Gammaproteobacteria bacterium]|nr:phospho-sugar mutase [Gammaproteobacteria bacterium]